MELDVINQIERLDYLTRASGRGSLTGFHRDR
jgi:hypothetical protein